MSASIVDALRYDRWATLTLIDACRPLTKEQLETRTPGTSGSIAELFAHLVGGQRTFALRTQGRQHEGEWGRASPWPGFDALRNEAADAGDELIAIASRLGDDEEADLPFQGKVFRFPKVFFLTHALEHAATHRTEITVALTHLGVEHPDLDGWSYSAAAGYGREVGA